MEDRVDKSKDCGFRYEESWVEGNIEEYYDKYCKNCVYMHEICMFGEE